MTNNSKKHVEKIIVASDLRSFFFNELKAVNDVAINPVAEEIIFYSSSVLDSFTHSHRYFDVQEGKFINKVLGTKLMEAQALGNKARERAYQDVAETSLVLCGMFRDSLNKKIVDASYYETLGVNAFEGLNLMQPTCFDVHNFYLSIAENFKYLTELFSAISEFILNREQVVPIKIKKS